MARHEKQYVVSADTVLDNRTGLQWQREVPAGTFTRDNAKGYAARLKLGGYSDWRLPTKEELKSIVDFSHHDPSIDTVAFPNTPPEFFWSSSPSAFNTYYAWGVNFNFGYTDNIDTTNSYRVRCAR